MYRVSGLTTGLRAEWSTYVDGGDGTPRFMIIRARAAEGSLDPIGPLAPAEAFLHSLDPDGTIRTAMNTTVLQNGVPVVTPDNLFNSAITLPDPGDRQYVVPTREWVTANDFIFWRNGVNDRIFHNSTSHSAPMISVDLADVTLDDDSEWAPFLDPVPGHVLVYLDKIQFMISPWWNVTETDGHVDPATLANLGDLKKSLYSGLTNATAFQVLSGSAEPTVRSVVEDSPPSVHWHWRIPAAQLAAFRSAAGLPPGLDLAAVRLQDDDAAADHWLSLTVSRRSGDGAGLRAEWTTTVDDGDGVRTLILESRSDQTALNPVDLFAAPSPITHTIGSDTREHHGRVRPHRLLGLVRRDRPRVAVHRAGGTGVGRRRGPALLAQRRCRPGLLRQHRVRRQDLHRPRERRVDLWRPLGPVHRRHGRPGLAGPGWGRPRLAPVVEPERPVGRGPEFPRPAGGP